MARVSLALESAERASRELESVARGSGAQELEETALAALVSMSSSK